MMQTKSDFSNQIWPSIEFSGFATAAQKMNIGDINKSELREEEKT